MISLHIFCSFHSSQFRTIQDNLLQLWLIFHTFSSSFYCVFVHRPPTPQSSSSSSSMFLFTIISFSFLFVMTNWQPVKYNSLLSKFEMVQLLVVDLCYTNISRLHFFCALFFDRHFYPYFSSSLFFFFLFASSLRLSQEWLSVSKRKSVSCIKINFICIRFERETFWYFICGVP